MSPLHSTRWRSRARSAAAATLVFFLCRCATTAPARGADAAGEPARAAGAPTAPASPPAAPPAASPAPAPEIAPHDRPVRAAPPAEEPVRAVARVTLGAVGDVLMHGAVKDAAAARRGAGPDLGHGWLYAPIADLLAAPDLMFANLETPIAPRADKGARSFVFNAPVAAVVGLQQAGVDLVSVANNHMFDQGRDGFEETLQRLDAAGMPYVGAGAAPREAGPRRIEKNGLALAFLGFAQFFNAPGNDCPAETAGRCLKAALLEADRAVAAVRAAAATADAVVVSVHWGVEYASAPRPQEVELAHRLADAGALVVLGHHPHVLQPIELYRRSDGRTAVIAYSLGNFISNQSRHYVHGVTPAQVGATRDGVLLRLALERRDYGRGVSRVEVTAVHYVPLWTENDTAELDRKADPAARPSIRVVALDRALAEVRAQLAGLPDPVPPAQQPLFVKLRQREELYLARRQAILAVLGEDLAADLAGLRTGAY